MMDSSATGATHCASGVAHGDSKSLPGTVCTKLLEHRGDKKRACQKGEMSVISWSGHALCLAATLAAAAGAVHTCRSKAQ